MKDHRITIAIASGKGGTGKTLIATNLWQTLYQLQYEVVLVDCDAEEPNDNLFMKAETQNVTDVMLRIPVIDESKCTYCGKCKEYCNYNAIFLLPVLKNIQVLEELCHGCGACLVACQDDAITEKEVLEGRVTRMGYNGTTTLVEAKMEVGRMSPVGVIKRAIKVVGKEGIVLLDAPPGTSCPFIQTAIAADFVVLVTEPTPFGLSDLKQSVETLKTMNKPLGVIINRAGLGDDAVYQYLESENIPLLLEIPFDKRIVVHYSKGELLVQQMTEWQQSFMDMFNKIMNIYGNSHH